MNNNILLSKIVANSTDKTWSQAYSTINLYIVISLEKIDVSEENIVLVGKGILEKLQREFFALDKKKLQDIKSAVSKSVENLNKEIQYSIVLSTIINNALYIVTGGEGAVIIIRDGELGVVAKGEKEEIISFSGVVKNNDVIMLQTKGFYQKVPFDKILSLSSNLEAMEISENIAPLIHEDSLGTEAAIVLNYKGKDKEENLKEEDLESEDELVVIDESPISKKAIIPKIKIPQFDVSTIFKKLFPSGKKKIIFGAIVIFTLVLVVGISFEKSRADRKKNQEVLQAVLSPAQKKYDEGNALLDLNKNLAFEDYKAAQQMLIDSKDRFKEGTDERKKINDLASSIDEKIKSIDLGAAPKNQNLIIDTGKSSDIKQIGSITLKSGDLGLLDKSNGNIFLLSKKDGSIIQKIDAAIKNPGYITGDEKYIYAFGSDGVYRSDNKGKKAEKIATLSNISDYVGMDTFLGNIYLLNKEDTSIEKYLAPSFDKNSYLIDGVKLSDSPNSITIDGSIWVLAGNGEIKKFTKGKEDAFTVKNLRNPLTKDSILYTDADYNNIYVLDKTNQKVMIIAKNGDFQNQIDLKSFEKVNSFGVDEANKNIYVSTDTKIYSFEF